uniref:Protein FAR1-RELATED SEQUENCE n=1 Tax=Daucus carota subsp. sativus TaxID=79200 RepID=A0A164WLG5_DAUCS
METKIVFPGVYSAELVVCTMWEALRPDISLLAEKCLLWLLLEAGSLPVNVFQGCLIDESLPFSLCKNQDRNVQDADDYDGEPKDDGVTPKDDDIYEEVNDGLEDHNMSGGESSGEGDQEVEDNSGSYGNGGSDDNDDDDTDMEEYSDDDEEEETDEEDEDDREDDRSNSEDSTDDNKQFPRLKNARDVYTSEDTFRLFEHERRKTRTLDIDVISDLDLRRRGLEITYEVRKSWQFEGRYTVTVLPMDGIVECSCKFFESSGVLCSHSQLALKCLRIDKIPDCCILQKDKNLTPGPAEGSVTKNQEERRQSSPHHTDFNRFLNFLSNSLPPVCSANCSVLTITRV